MTSASGGTGGSSATDRDATAALKSRWALLIGSACSIGVLAGALALQAEHSWILKLPTQWLAVAAIPALVGLVLGGYIRKFSLAGVELEAPPLKPVGYVTPGGGPQDRKVATSIRPDWTRAREEEYERTHRLALVHIYKPSTRRNQKYDISIYLMRHHSGQGDNQTVGFTEIERAEFFFGSSWGNRIFTSSNDGGVIGVNTSAWGTFLATCRVAFNDGSAPIVLHRYIDFEMAPS
jgi:hypothetical protein